MPWAFKGEYTCSDCGATATDAQGNVNEIFYDYRPFGSKVVHPCRKCIQVRYYKRKFIMAGLCVDTDVVRKIPDHAKCFMISNGTIVRVKRNALEVLTVEHVEAHIDTVQNLTQRLFAA